MSKINDIAAFTSLCKQSKLCNFGRPACVFSLLCHGQQEEFQLIS